MAERFLGDWNEGRLDRSYAEFSARLQQLVTPTQLEASLVAVRDALGKYVAITGVRVAEERIDDQPAVVLDTTLRFERGTTSARFALLSERGAWRLRFLKVELPVAQRPSLDDAPVARIAGELLGVIQREGLRSVARLLPKEAKERFGEEAVRAVFERMADTLGALRSHSLEAPAVLGEECRQVAGRARFEHGDGALRMAFCPDQGVWRLIAIDIQPVMTAAVFERLVRAHLAQMLARRDFELSCPPALVPVGKTAACRLASGGRTRTVRALRIDEGDVDVTLAPE